MIGVRRLRRQGQLGRFPRLYFLQTPAALFSHAPKPHLAGRLNEHQMVTNNVPTGLQHDGRVQHDQPHHRVGPGRLHLCADTLLDPRMDHRFQSAALAGIREHHIGEKATLYLPFIVEQLLAPASNHQLHNSRLAQGGVREGVARNHAGAAAGECFGDLTLAGADAADQTHN